MSYQQKILKALQICVAQENKTKSYFHVTDIKNLLKIKRLGLVPYVGDFSQKADEKKPMVYLFKTEGYALNAIYGWLGEEYQLRYENKGMDSAGNLKLAILKINLPAKFPIHEGNKADGEMLCEQKIPIQYISPYLGLTLGLDYDWSKRPLK